MKVIHSEYPLYEGKDSFIKQVKSTKGAKIIFEKDNIVLIKVKKFKACNKLFNIPSINWCIARDKQFWYKYAVGWFKRQYFIVDFNKTHSPIERERNESVIGFTTSENAIVAAHAKDDANLRTTFYYILTDKGINEEVYAEINNFKGIFANILSWILVICFIALVFCVLGR